MAKDKDSSSIVDAISKKAGNLPSVDDLIKLIPGTDVDGSFDRPEFPERHYICINWASDYEFRQRISLIQDRLRKGYIVDKDHPLGNDSTLFMYCSIGDYNSRQTKLAEFSEYETKAPDSVNVTSNRVEPSEEVSKALQELATAQQAVAEDGI